MPATTRLHQLVDHGQRVWIDFLSRDLLSGGELARMMRDDGVSGVTSNPTIFAKALSLQQVPETTASGNDMVSQLSY